MVQFQQYNLHKECTIPALMGQQHSGVVTVPLAYGQVH